MFDLDREVAQWRRAMAAGGVSDPAVLDELESHLRDYIAQEVRLGREPELAFKAGLERIGQASVLKREFCRANKMQLLTGVIEVLDDRRKCFWGALVLSALVSVAFYCWQVRVRPVYEGVATLQLGRLGPPVFSAPVGENDVRNAENLTAFTRLLVSKQLRTKVEESLTPAEQKIVRRATATRHGSNETETVNDPLGALTVRSMRLSLIVTVSVVQEDAEAAALIANRYVEQCRVYFRKVADSQRIVFRVISPATPSRYPIAPNLPRILRTSIGITLATFVSLMTMAAALRKLMHMRMNIGPQMRTS